MIFKVILFVVVTFTSFQVYANATRWLDFTLSNGHIQIPITVGGIETVAILDSGAQVHAINQAFINKHDLKLSEGSGMLISGVYGVEKKTTYNNIPIEFFGMETELDKIPELGLGDDSVGFLLGAPFFSNYVFQIDYPNERMRLILRNSVNVSDFANIKMKKQKGSGVPIVQVGFPDDKYLWLLFDTGSTAGVTVERHVAENLGWLKEAVSQSGTSAGVNEVVTTESIRHPLVKFGPYELENVLVTIPDVGDTNIESRFKSTVTKIKGHRVKGILGYDILKHFVITFDYKMGRAHIGLPE